ncbi:MAG TPA: hypothetical protein DHW82_06835 [Spirochaetia bacterium]|nr:MAG: hypothetical protein A2Y41_00810 [Spirochaetes bacterium GWB1_36_13]HCL56710.1 hypothetical protein [Spirochaetia bacterium]
MKFLSLFSLIVCFFTSCNSKNTTNQNPSHPIIGKWEYMKTTYKNTSVRGTISFYENGTMEIEAEARDDYPVGNIDGTYDYQIKGNEILSEYDSYGFDQFFLIEGDYLYFSTEPIQTTQFEWIGNRIKADWTWKLKKQFKKD